MVAPRGPSTTATILDRKLYDLGGARFDGYGAVIDYAEFEADDA